MLVFTEGVWFLVGYFLYRKLKYRNFLELKQALTTLVSNYVDFATIVIGLQNEVKSLETNKFIKENRTPDKS